MTVRIRIQRAAKKVPASRQQRLPSRFALDKVTGGTVAGRVLNDYAKSAPAVVSSLGVPGLAPGAARLKDQPGLAKGLQAARGGLKGRR